MIFKSYEINQKQKIVLQKNIFLLYGENYGLKKEIAQKKNILEDYMQSMYDSMWLKGLNLNDQEILTQVASESGLDPNDFAEGISSDEIKNELKATTQFAIDKGAFGVPTYFSENEMFWGIDSVKFLVESLNS